MACNIACHFCNAAVRREELRFVNMPDEMMDRLHASIAAMGVRGVQYCGGGEPTLWRNGRIADYIAALPAGITRAAMASNIVKGHHLARPDTLARMAFLEVAVFSYDDPTYEMMAGVGGTHTRVRDSLEKILAARAAAGLDHPFVNAKILISDRNYLWFSDIYDWVAGAGFDNIHVRLVDDYEHTGAGFVLNDAQRTEFAGIVARYADSRGLPHLTDQLPMIVGTDNKGVGVELNHCWTVALGMNCWVLSNGKVFACGPQWGNEDYCIGDLNHANLEDIWGSPRHQEVAELLIAKMGSSRCFALGCRHARQTQVIDLMRDGSVTVPPASEFTARHAEFL